MGVPKKHTTKGSRNQRRAHKGMAQPDFVLCNKCKAAVRRHTVCKNCGYYKNMEVINVLAKLEKKERKKREKEMKETEKEKKDEKPLTMEELSRKKF